MLFPRAGDLVSPAMHCSSHSKTHCMLFVSHSKGQSCILNLRGYLMNLLSQKRSPAPKKFGNPCSKYPHSHTDSAPTLPSLLDIPFSDWDCFSTLTSRMDGFYYNVQETHSLWMKVVNYKRKERSGPANKPAGDLFLMGSSHHVTVNQPLWNDHNLHLHHHPLGIKPTTAGCTKYI